MEREREGGREGGSDVHGGNSGKHPTVVARDFRTVVRGRFGGAFRHVVERFSGGGLAACAHSRKREREREGERERGGGVGWGSKVGNTIRRSGFMSNDAAPFR